MALKNERSSYIATVENENKAVDRTAPVYVITDGQLALDDITKPKPNDYDKQIDISWIDEALDKKAFETKYSAWDLIKCPYGMFRCSCFGNAIGVFIDNRAVITKDNGENWEEIPLNNENISCITYAEYNIENVSDTGEVTVTEIKIFVMLSLDGKCYYTLDNFNTINEFIVPDDIYTAVIYYNNKFIAFTSSGKIYLSDNQGKEIKETAYFDIQFRSAAYDENGCIVAVGHAGQERAVYSNDYGISWHTVKIDNNNQYTYIVYGEGKFVACSYDGVERLLIFKYDTENKTITSYPKTLPKDYQFFKISYGSRVFVLISLDGNILSSFDGESYIETKSALTGYINILRTDNFFIVCSINENETGFNAVRSSNGGLLGIQFATLQEIIDNEKSNKSIDIQGANGWFNWLENERGITAQDVRITFISPESSVLSYNELTRAGEYYILKNLNDKPDDTHISGRLTVQYIKHNNETFVTQIFEPYTETSYFKFQRQFSLSGILNNQYGVWTKSYIYQDKIFNIDLSKNNVEVTLNTSISAVRTFLAVDNNGNVSNIDSIDLSDDKIKASQIIRQSAVKTFLAVDNNGNVSNIDSIDLSDDKIKASQIIRQSAVKTFLAVDNNGIVKQASLNDIKNFIGLGKLAYKDTIETNDIKNGAVYDLKLYDKGTQFLNVITVSEFFRKCGYNSGVKVTIQELVTKIPTYSFYMLNTYIWNSGSQPYLISDLPCNPAVLTFRKIDVNYCLVTAHYPYDYREYRNVLKNNVLQGWVQVLNSDGTITLNASSLSNLIKNNASLIRTALGLGSLAMKNSVNLSDLTQTTGILPSARGGFNYNDYLG